MRLLSMAARLGGSVPKALADMREVVWDKGPVRCGHVEREDGKKIPMFHDSEVAAIGYMLQRMLIRRGFLDPQGNQASLAAMSLSLGMHGAPALAVLPDSHAVSAVSGPGGLAQKCPDCGAYALRKIDGCTRCTECHYIGSCGCFRPAGWCTSLAYGLRRQTGPLIRASFIRGVQRRRCAAQAVVETPCA
jgi:ribonucleoside-diphosphate reductase alpha chain